MTEAEHRRLEEDRKLYIDADREGARSFDKYVLLLASGAFATTIAFLRDVVPDIELEVVPLLMMAWLMFGVSIMSTLASFLGSQYACKAYIQDCDRRLSCPESCPSNLGAMIGHVVTISNILAIIFLLLGFFFWMAFVGISLSWYAL